MQTGPAAAFLARQTWNLRSWDLARKMVTVPIPRARSRDLMPKELEFGILNLLFFFFLNP